MRLKFCFRDDHEDIKTHEGDENDDPDATDDDDDDDDDDGHNNSIVDEKKNDSYGDQTNRCKRFVSSDIWSLLGQLGPG